VNYSRPVAQDYPMHDEELAAELPGMDQWPAPCWEQNGGESTAGQFYDPIVRWGDQRNLFLKHIGIGSGTVQKPSGQLVQYEVRKPYATRVSLNATSPDIAAASANLFVTWTVYIGAGAAQRTYMFVQQVQPLPTTPTTDLTLSFAAEVIRVTAVAEFNASFVPQQANVTVSAMCAPESYIPDDEVGPRRVRGAVR